MRYKIEIEGIEYSLPMGKRIAGCELTLTAIGANVAYCPNGVVTKGETPEKGKIVMWDEKYVYVDYTYAIDATAFEDLLWI